jgi:hypothetical protein
LQRKRSHSSYDLVAVSGRGPVGWEIVRWLLRRRSRNYRLGIGVRRYEDLRGGHVWEMPFKSVSDWLIPIELYSRIIWNNASWNRLGTRRSALERAVDDLVLIQHGVANRVLEFGASAQATVVVTALH